MEKKILSATCKGASIIDRWYIEIYEIDHNGKKIRRKVYGGINRKKTVKARQDAANEIIKELSAPTAALPTNDYYALFCGAVLRFGVSFKKKTKQTFQSKIDIFCRWYENNQYKTIDKKTCDEFVFWLQTNKKHATTINAYFATLSWCYARALPEDKNPFIRPKLKTTKTPKMDFSDNERKMILEYCDENDKQLALFLRMMFVLLIRPGELRLLQIKHINFDRYFIDIPPGITKTGTQHQLVISNQLMQYLTHLKPLHKNFYLFSTKRAPDARPVGARYFGLRHQNIIAALGFDTTRYSLYSWKHTGAIALYNHTNDINFVKNQIGHANIATTEIYLQRRKYWNDEKSRDRFPEI